ncbi:MAG: T9SS type A sorting domain-containing protein [Bacteroidetes bacterium]|nr:MAG: T9SS type A sorting domain-containing protein [Bacteroidota bacterium]
MKIIVILFLIVLNCISFSQPIEYNSRGTKSYIVNYGAIGGNPFLASFASKRFVMVDEGSKTDISQIHKFNPALPILLYKDVVAIYPSFPEYTEVNKDEFAFLHSCEPSGLTYSKMTTDNLIWLADRRSPDIIGYRLYYSSDSLVSYSMIDTIINSTNYNSELPQSALWIKVKSVLNDYSELNYGFPVLIQVAEVGANVPSIIINDSRTTDTVRIHIECENIGNIEPDSVVISIDLNRNNVYDASERIKLLKSSNRWIYDNSLGYNNTSAGGYEFIIYAYKGGLKSQSPSIGAYTTNINNRLKNDYYNFYVCNVGNSTWRRGYIGTILNTFDEYGYNGLFEDDTWYKVSSWAVDCPAIYAYRDDVWKKDICDFLDTIKSAISPRPAFFNGLYAGDADSLLLHADGGMTEGYGSTHWSGIMTLPYWKELCDVGLKCQHKYKKLWLCLGGISNSDPEARLYSYASYMLVADSLGLFANANNYQEFAHYPEFDIPLGKSLESASLDVDVLKQIYEPTNTEYYIRRFENGVVVVNPNSTKYIVQQYGAGKNSLYIDNKLTVDGARIYQYKASDTIYPKQARIYLNSNFEGNTLVSPYIDTIIVDALYNNSDETTKVTIKALVSDSSSKMFRSNSDLPLYVTAELGSLGGPTELLLANDGTPASAELSEYQGSFIMPPNVASGIISLPIVAYSTTGLLTVGYGKINIPGTNIIQNYSFEIDAGEDGIPDMWNSYVRGFIYDTTGANAKSGKRSVSVKNDSLSWSGGVNMRLILDQTEPKPLLLSGWSKAENVSGNKDNNYSLYIDIRYQDGTPLYGQCAQFSTGTHDWEYSDKIINPTKPIKDLTLYALFRNHTGQVWYDQLSLGDYDSTVAVKEVKFPNHFEIFPNPSVDKCYIRINSNQISDKAEIKIHNELGEILDLETTLIYFDGNEVIFEINISNLVSGIYFAKFKSEHINKSILFVVSK